MHPLDTQRNINWVVHLVGKVMVATWVGAVIAALLDATTAVEGVTAFFLLWPLVIGLWLLASGAPFPTYLSDEDLAAAAGTES